MLCSPDRRYRPQLGPTDLVVTTLRPWLAFAFRITGEPTFQVIPAKRIPRSEPDANQPAVGQFPAASSTFFDAVHRACQPSSNGEFGEVNGALEIAEPKKETNCPRQWSGNQPKASEESGIVPRRKSLCRFFQPSFLAAIDVRNIISTISESGPSNRKGLVWAQTSAKVSVC